MSRTTVVGARMPIETADQFRQQANRLGLSPSVAVGLLIKGALAYEREHAPSVPDASADRP